MIELLQKDLGFASFSNLHKRRDNWNLLWKLDSCDLEHSGFFQISHDEANSCGYGEFDCQVVNDSDHMCSPNQWSSEDGVIGHWMIDYYEICKHCEGVLFLPKYYWQSNPL